MPIVTIKNATVLSSGAVSAAYTNENFYEPDATTPDTLEVVDGWLDTHNHPDINTDPIQWDSFQPGSFIRWGQRGANAAFDVFDDLFPRNTFLPNDPTEDTTNFIPLPGANIRFYLPYAPSAVLFSWMVNWTTDLLYIDGEDYTAPCSPAHFVVDGSFPAQPHTQRRVAVATVSQLGAGAGFGTDIFPRVSQADQKWSGHKYVTGLAAGWHTAGIYLGMSDAHGDGPNAGDISQQARVRSRSIRYIAFK